MMELNKYDLILWVADLFYRNRFSDEFCKHCMFLRDDNQCIDCHNKQKVVNALLKKYNL
jgi:hypothetical protein